MTLLHLISNPPTLSRLRAEIDTATAAGKLSSPIVQDSEARELCYLQAVIKEGFRIFPAVTALFFKIVPPGGDAVSGYHLPPGTQVGPNAPGVLRSKKYFGDDADLFRPKRWLEADAETLERMTMANDVVFGYGRYKCLGRSIAMMELNKVLPEVSVVETGAVLLVRVTG
jgi:cytochrome P450